MLLKCKSLQICKRSALGSKFKPESTVLHPSAHSKPKEGSHVTQDSLTNERLQADLPGQKRRVFRMQSGRFRLVVSRFEWLGVLCCETCCCVL